MSVLLHPLVDLKATKKFSVYHVLTLREAGWKVLQSQDLQEKARLTFEYVGHWKNGDFFEVGHYESDTKESNQPMMKHIVNPPEEGYSAAVKSMMKKNSIEYTVHGIANAEAYAIDLFWDLISNFQRYEYELPIEFYEDMLYIAQQEAEHYSSWMNRLHELGQEFGSFPTTDALWIAASNTSGNSIIYEQL